MYDKTGGILGEEIASYTHNCCINPKYSDNNVMSKKQSDLDLQCLTVYAQTNCPNICGKYSINIALITYVAIAQTFLRPCDGSLDTANARPWLNISVTCVGK